MIIDSEWMRVWGRRMWAELHRRPFECRHVSQERAWIDAFLARIPCKECQDHFRLIVAELLPDLSSREAYFRWTVEAHNRVNIVLGKSVMESAKAWEHWRSTTAPAALPTPPADIAALVVTAPARQRKAGCGTCGK